ncbi:MAG: SH3 domain-containing protein [Patescibacteria group bacterium]|nr:SH3 domain-containing protein [Patescibacteria group bacterium]
MSIMPRRAKKEDKDEGGLNLHIVKNDSEESEKPSVAAEETVLFLKNRVASACPESDGLEEGPVLEEGSEEEDTHAKKRLSIYVRIFVFLLVIAGIGFGFRLANRSGYSACLVDNGAAVGDCGTALKKLEDGLVVDKVRLADAGSVIAGLQKYSVEKKVLPDKLTSLLAGGYIPKNYSDPEFDKPYFYKKQNNGSYSFCVYLSSGVWGINPAGCPSKEAYLSNLDGEIAPTPSAETRTITVQETPIGWLNVRRSATTDSAVVAKAYAGEQYRVLEEKGDWIRIPLKSSVLINGEQVIEGWVYKSYVR